MYFPEILCVELQELKRKKMQSPNVKKIVFVTLVYSLVAALGKFTYCHA